MRIKKYLVIILSIVMAVLGLSACGTQKTEDKTTKETHKLKIVTTIFPEYDWVKNILGDQADQAEIKMLLDNGVDLHSYQPTAEDIMQISQCDLFIYVGGESDAWVEDALKEAVNKNMKVINLLDVLKDTIKEEEVVEGMQAEEEEEGDEGEEEEPEYDEHVWLSLRNAETLCQSIEKALAELNPSAASSYENNLNQYLSKMKDLDQKYQEVVNDGKNKTLLFGDRFPFRYLVDDYNLKYYAAFVGCSAETQASFKTITFLAGKVDELGLNTVLTIEKSDQKIANAIVKNTKSKSQKILSMDSMQSTTSEDIKNGETYLGAMEENLGVLQKALQ